MSNIFEFKNVPILDKNAMRQHMVENKELRNARVFRGTMQENLETTTSEAYTSLTARVTTPEWLKSGRREEFMAQTNSLKQRIMANQAQPSQAELAELIGRYYIDILRTADDLVDYVPTLCNVHNDPNMQKRVDLRDYLPYTGKEKVMTGTNDSVPLIEENLGAIQPVDLEIKAFGHNTSLYQMVFNPIYDVNKVLQAAATIRVDGRNDEVIGAIVRGTYDAAHSQAADTTGATADLKLYNTLKAALQKVKGLYQALYPNKKMSSIASSAYLLCNTGDADRIQPIVSGALSVMTGINQLVGALNFNGIIPYDGGQMDGLTWGKETLSLPGVAEGVAYVVLVNQYGMQYMQKRDVQMETGSGSVLQLSQQQSAWYRITKNFTSWAIGGTDTDTGHAVGSIVKIALPSA
jgi:hypothetical protein